MRREWWGRWTGAACAVAGCAPMLFALIAGTLGAAGAQGARMVAAGPMAAPGMAGPAAAPMTGPVATPAMGMMPGGGAPAWVATLGQLSWPLLIASALLLVWSFRHAPPAARLTGYAGVALLIVNQFSMTPWLFLPALALLAAGFVAARAGSAGRNARTGIGGHAPVG